MKSPGIHPIGLSRKCTFLIGVVLVLPGLLANIAGRRSLAATHPGRLSIQDQQSEAKDLILALDEASSLSERQRILGKLKKLGAKTLIALKQLPKGLSGQTRLSLLRVKFEIEQAINQAALRPSRFSLSGSFTLNEALEKIETQTGIIIESQIEKTAPRELEFKDVEFWKGMDQVLDQFNADVYRFSESSPLKIIKSSRAGSRSKLTCYSGIAKVEATHLLTSTDLKNGERSFDRIWFDVRWEPRLKPMELIVDHESIEIVDGSGKKRSSLATKPIVRTISAGDSYRQFDIQFAKIPRTISSIKSIRGKLRLKTRIGRKQFQFPGILGTKNKSKRIGETTVTIVSATHADSALQVAMQFEIDNPGDSLDSHRGWMFQNKAFLVDKKLNRILSDKIMTTSQEKNKMGFVFTFANIDGPEGFDFVYETPTSIREIPLNWQLDNIELK